MLKTRLILLLSIAWLGFRAQAYPEFIGYGYSTCITCHFNGNGGGPLTDYGRALWSSEIASRALYPKSMTDEQIAAQSGFLGPVQLPYWIRPHADYRGIDVDSNPGSAGSGSTKYYQMVTDFGLTVQNASGRIGGLITFGRIVPPDQYGLGKPGFDHIMAEEYYLRAEIVKTWWVYAGMMEKVFGIRNDDHTSYQRTFQGFNVENNTIDGSAESQGVILQKISEKWEISGNAFFGNPYDSPQYKQTGGSAMGEVEVFENGRLGASVLSSHSQVEDKQMVAIHHRQQFSKGSALIFEYGLIKNVQPSQPTQVGSYNLIQAMMLLTRGYNLITGVERYNSSFSTTVPDQWRWEFGFLMYPIPRLELRLEALNMRNLSGESATDDSWAIEGQVHVAL